MGCYFRLQAAQAMIPEMPALRGGPPMWSIFVTRVGGIDQCHKPQMRNLLRPDTPTGAVPAGSSVGRPGSNVPRPVCN
jgi:hypothetical protein